MVWRKLWLLLAAAIFAAEAFLPVPGDPQSVPYYIRQATTAISSTTLTFSGLQGQGLCAFSLNSTGGANTTVSNAVSSFPTGASTPIQFIDTNGNAMGSTFSTTSQVTGWFNGANATSIVFTVAPAGTYTYTLICTTTPWPFGAIQWHQGNNNGASVYNVYADYWPDALGVLATASITTPGTTLQLTGINGMHWYIYYAGCQAQGALTSPTCMFEGGSGGSCGTNTKPVFPTGLPGPTTTGDVVPVYAGATIATATAPAGMVPADKPFILASGANGCWVFTGTLTGGVVGQVYAVQGP